MVFLWKMGKWSLWLVAFSTLLLVFCNYWVIWSVQSRMTTSLDEVENRDVALVLGTSPRAHGQENLFFTYRMQATAELYHAGKVKHIIVSGDNAKADYNEPRYMLNALVALGVPDSCITMDFAGFRTLDSVVRCKEIFQQNRVVIVSQEFHNYRALFIARHVGLDAIAYNAMHPPFATPKTTVREYFARAKAILDLYVTGTQPKFLGDKIDIGV